MMISNEINITNINDNETLNYEILLIKGTIYHYCQNDNKELNVTLNGNNIMSYRIQNKQFKILLELTLGENNIIVNYCCVSKDIKINLIRNSTFKVVPLYIINKNHNGEFQAPENIENNAKSACKRIQTIAKLLQCVIAEKLYEDGFGRKSFEIENCRIFHSNLDVGDLGKMNQKELWVSLGREIMNSQIGDSKNKYLGFLSCTKYTGNKDITKYEDMIKLTKGYVAIGGGGLALFGTACMYTWPETILDVFEKFEDNTNVDSDNFLNDSCYRNTLGACFSTTLGSVLHELCHAFDLGHTTHGVMGRGFDNIYKFFIDLSEKSSNSQTNFKPRNGFIRKSNTSNTEDSHRKTVDETYFTTSCGALLSYHKYFNNYSKSPENFLLTMDRKTKFVKSTIGIRVIEIREGITEIVLNSWIFTGKILKYSFQIPDDIANRIVVVEDNCGNILKDESNDDSK